MDVVLGGRGAVGRFVSEALTERKRDFIAPSSRETDARDAEALIRACQGATTILCCVGLPYRSAIWRRDWPRVASALVKAGEATGARLVYLDNTYAYGPKPLAVPITEDHPQNPPSGKGRARKTAADILMEAHRTGRASVTIARAADFYGPGATDSVLWASFLERMLQAEAPQLLMSPAARHTYAYTPDIARALVLLAEDPEAAGRIWHLPVGPAWTPDLWTETFNRLLGTALKPACLPPAASAMLGLISARVREAHEMRYQFDSDYILSDAAFHHRYPDFVTTSYEAGAARLVAWAKARA